MGARNQHNSIKAMRIQLTSGKMTKKQGKSSEKDNFEAGGVSCENK